MTDMPRPHDDDEMVERIRAIDVVAPKRLHDRVDAMVAERKGHQARGGAPLSGLRLRLGATAAALAAVAVALTVALSGSGSAGASLAQASALTLRPATLAAPSESASRNGTLAADVEGVSFPYWEERFHWRSTGSRLDTLDGHAVRTVFYSDPMGRTVGYAIVAGRAPRLTDAGQVHWREGTPFALGRVDGAEVVTWRRNGHLCVVSGRGVSGSTLIALASWNERPSAA